MTIEEVYKYFITAKKAAEVIGISRETFHKWVRWGRIPAPQQTRYEKLTKGKLKASEGPDPVRDIIYPSYRFWDDTHGMCDVIALTFFKSHIIRIKVAIPKTKLPLVSFETHRLMQSVYMKDAKGQLLFEKDMVFVNKRKRTLENIFDNELLEILKYNKFFIVGNVFEGGQDV